MRLPGVEQDKLVFRSVTGNLVGSDIVKRPIAPDCDQRRLAHIRVFMRTCLGGGRDCYAAEW